MYSNRIPPPPFPCYVPLLDISSFFREYSGLVLFLYSRDWIYFSIDKCIRLIQVPRNVGLLSQGGVWTAGNAIVKSANIEQPSPTLRCCCCCRLLSTQNAFLLPLLLHFVFAVFEFRSLSPQSWILWNAQRHLNNSCNCNAIM